MPRRIKLAGKRFGSWTVIRLDPQRDKHGRRRLWRCRCKYGQRGLILGQALREGKSTSCGCSRRLGRYGRPFTKRDVRAGVEEKAKQLVDGRWWFANRAARRYLDVTFRTLSIWRVKCPWLNDQGIETRPLPDYLGRLTFYYAKADLDRIRAAMANRPPIPDVPDFTHIDDAATQLGLTSGWLRQRMKAKGVKVKEVNGKDKLGKATGRSYVPNWFVNECKRDRLGDPKPASKLTFSEAANILGVCKSAVQKMVARKLLRGRPGKALDSAGSLRTSAVLLDRPEVEALHALRTGHKSTIPTENDSGGTGEHKQQPRPGGRKTRGRKEGHTKDWEQRVRAMLKDWDEGKFGNNKAAAGRAYDFHRPDASKVIKEHERKKRRNNSPP